MVIRELKDGRCYVSLQEDHAELAAQFAARWGNARFSQTSTVPNDGLRNDLSRQRLSRVGRQSADERRKRPALRPSRRRTELRRHRA